jgi:TPP-dependent pyruvate/acetoin dehydrogenase alpha subunit
VPSALLQFWQRRDPIARFENYLVRERRWLTPGQNRQLIEAVEDELQKERAAAENSPMPEPETAAGGVYCEEGCHQIGFRYARPKWARPEKGMR